MGTSRLVRKQARVLSRQSRVWCSPVCLRSRKKSRQASNSMPMVRKDLIAASLLSKIFSAVSKIVFLDNVMFLVIHLRLNIILLIKPVPKRGAQSY